MLTCACTCKIILCAHVQEHCDSEENENCVTKDCNEDEIYWEPARSVNELYKQLCSNKYREIVREEVK
jgi:hypothetical protein